MAMAVANADDERPGGKSPSGGKIGGGRKSSDFSQYRSLADFGYGFDHLGQLRQLSDGQPTELPFKFEVKPGNRAYNQRHYEALGEMLTEEVYHLLESSGLERLAVPSMVEEDGGGGGAVPQSFVFASPDYATADELLVLIHGSGVVRAGQWARRLIINESLEKGTQLPYIREGLARGLGIIVLNTNLNRQPDQQSGDLIPGSEDPEDHASSVWASLIQPAAASHIFIVAHSYGGIVAMSLAWEFKEDFLSRVRLVELTDSVHYGLTKHKEVDRRLRRIGKNYVTSSLPVGTPVRNSGDIECVSAGHEIHEWTSWSAMESIFKDIDRALAKEQAKMEEISSEKKEASSEKKEASSGTEKMATEEL